MSTRQENRTNMVANSANKKTPNTKRPPEVPVNPNRRPLNESHIPSRGIQDHSVDPKDAPFPHPDPTKKKK